MKVSTPLQTKKAALLKAFRALIRLKYSLLADAEIAERLPQLEKEIDLAWQQGRELEIDLAEIINRVDTED